MLLRVQFMKRVPLFLVLFLLVRPHAFATWSVLAVSQTRGRVVIASATCLALEPPQTLMKIQAVVVPGKGVAAAQALLDPSGANQKLIFEELEKGTPPDEILRLVRARDPNVEIRQFAIVDLEGRAAAFSGSGTNAVSTSVQGSIPAEKIFFSIQGNLLRNEDVVLEAANAFRAANGTITDRVMAAMEAADINGGDSRCTCETEPKPPTPRCEGKTSLVAYILAADLWDSSGSSFNDGKYTMYLSVTPRNTQRYENANPIKTLRARYNSYIRGRQPIK
jgi:Family of unknown function (DUF1028)